MHDTGCGNSAAGIFARGRKRNEQSAAESPKGPGARLFRPLSRKARFRRRSMRSSGSGGNASWAGEKCAGIRIPPPEKARKKAPGGKRSLLFRRGLFYI